MNTPNFAINGFGRIGRTALRVWWHYYRQQSNLKVINTSGSMEIEDWIHLLKYDSNYGVFDQNIEVSRQQSKDEVSDENPILGTIKLEDREIIITAQRDPAKLPWAQHNVDVVIESTGVFNTAEKAQAHLDAGAKNVLLSAPAKGEGVTSTVISASETDATVSNIHSNESCTTNCVAPVMRVITEKFGVKKALLTTIHAYTDDQNIQDNSHKKDLRRARSAAKNIIPTSTGAAKATTRIIPELKNHFDGLAIRVPVSVGSLSDITFVTKKATSVEEVNQALTEASKSARFKNILAVTNEPIVSNDVIGRRESSIVDLSLTNVIDGDLVKIISWYDNEWGYCNRLIEQINNVAK